VDGDYSKVAVVAWLDYSPPRADDTWGVAHDYLAEAGAQRLAGALNGLHAVRSITGSGLDVSVVGHSYGSTVSALALTHANADHLVMLGSAGVSLTIPDAGALLVPSGEVFASQGRHDGWAATGQAISGRQDPTSPSFGAHAFSSEQGIDDKGHPLHAVTQHGPFVSAGASGKYSYLNDDTSAIYNTARIAIGQGSGLPVHDTPAERLALQAQDRALDMVQKGTPWAPRG
jgi:pimeloyl-ACP methyl ester carboxylesterase